MDYIRDGLKEVAVYLVLAIFGFIGSEVHEMRQSIQSLNVNVAVILEQMHNYDQRISNLENQRGK